MDPGSGAISWGMEFVPPSGMKPTERRKHPRVTISVDVDFETGSNFYSGKTRDMSEGGVFVESPIFAPVGARIELQLRLFGHHYEVPVEVTWILCDEAGAVIGFGARFLELRRPVRRVIQEFMKAREPMPFELLELEDDEPAEVAPIIARPRAVPPPLPVTTPMEPPPLPLEAPPAPPAMEMAPSQEQAVSHEPFAAEAAQEPLPAQEPVFVPREVAAPPVEPAHLVALDRPATPIAMRRRSTLRFARGARARADPLLVAVPAAPASTREFEAPPGAHRGPMVH